MIHGGGHVMLSRKEIPREQIDILLKAGFLPVSIDYRLCPEITLPEGPMRDVCDAFKWAREKLPTMTLSRSDIRVNGQKVVAVGWSTGGYLAMTLGWTAVAAGIRPPEAVLAFYCPTDYEDPFWSKSNLPFGQKSVSSLDYSHQDLLKSLQDRPTVAYNPPVTKDTQGGWMTPGDSRSLIALHMNWKGQTLPVLLKGLKALSSTEESTVEAEPSIEEIKQVSPLAHIRNGDYTTPTFIIHGTLDDHIPWQQAERTYNTLVEEGVRAELRLLKDALHLFDIYRDHKQNQEAVKAVREGYEFLSAHV
jgi:acetyl esterase/lipase